MSKSKDLEQYYTKSKETKRVFEVLKKNALLDRCKIVIEPSVGTGSFIKAAKTVNKKWLAETKPDFIVFDIDPKVLLGAQMYVQKGDFLKIAPVSRLMKLIGSKSKNTCVIGNPPFKPAVKFFNTSSAFADLIAMILPIKFSKKFTQDKLNPYFRLVHSEILQCAFTLKKKDYCLPTVFQIWVRHAKKRKKEEKKQKKYWKITRLSKTTKKINFKNTDNRILIKRSGYNKTPVAWSSAATINSKVNKLFQDHPKTRLKNYFLYKVNTDLKASAVSKKINAYHRKHKNHFATGKNSTRLNWNKDEVYCAYIGTHPDNCKR
jgi:hypothetical protein